LVLSLLPVNHTNGARTHHNLLPPPLNESMDEQHYPSGNGSLLLLLLPLVRYEPRASTRSDTPLLCDSHNVGFFGIVVDADMWVAGGGKEGD
jgi:hypothetical protein